MSTSSQALVPAQRSIAVIADRNRLDLQVAAQRVDIGHKWQVFYALLAVHADRYVSVDEVCDHYPWTRQVPKVAGRELWRFTTQQESRYFGGRISHSPPRQATKQFALCHEAAQRVFFIPDALAVSHLLKGLCAHQESQAIALSECTLLIQSGFVNTALEHLQQLRLKARSINDQAHVEVLFSMCLDRLYGTAGTEQQRPVLEGFLPLSGLSRLNRIRILVRLARHFTLSEQYPEAAVHFETLRHLVQPDDGVEYCQFHINYSLFLRRNNDLPRAIQHQMLAHSAAHEAQWWYGVQAAQSNLALMHLSEADRSTGEAMKLHLRKAKEWALLCCNTTDATIQGSDHADSALTLSQACRRLGELPEAQHWAQMAVRWASRVPNLPDLVEAYEQLALVEEAQGNYFLAHLAWKQMHDTRLLIERAGG